MKWSEFFATRFGINMDQEVPTGNQQQTTSQQQQTTSQQQQATSQQQQTTQHFDASNNDEIAKLQAEIKQLKEANAQLAAGTVIGSTDDTPVEELLYNLFTGGKNNGNQNSSTAGMFNSSAG